MQNQSTSISNILYSTCASEIKKVMNKHAFQAYITQVYKVESYSNVWMTKRHSTK